MLKLRVDEHSWASRTLPWLANNSLAADELLRLKAHLDICAECRDELQWERAVASRITARPVVSLAPQASFARLIQRIDAAETPMGPAWWRALRQAARPRPKKRHFVFASAIAAQAAAIAALALALGWIATRPPPEPAYHTLTSPAQVERAAQLQVVFEESVTAAQMQAALAKIKGRIVGGPSPAGVFLVAIDPPAAGANLDLAARTLTAQPGVGFVAVLHQE
ncbi:MAG: zf-HC2 domain-containing protein [Nevskiales bacterium]